MVVMDDGKSWQKNAKITYRQFWQQHNKPVELWSNKVIQQKIDYIHHNPVQAGFVTHPADWQYSSACNYGGAPAVLEIDGYLS